MFMVATRNQSFIPVILNGQKFDMLVYTDHLQNWLYFGHHLLIFLNLVAFGETGKIWDFWLLKNTREEWPEIWYADVSCPPSELIRFLSWSVDFPHYGIILT